MGMFGIALVIFTILSTAPPSTSGTTTTTTTTTLAEHLVVGADIIMTDPVWITENTTWTSADGIRALAVRVEVLPGISLTIEGSRNSSVVLSFVHVDASIYLHPGATLVVRNAAFFTPFRGWRHLDGVPNSERPPSITGVKSDGGASLVMENVFCKGLRHCVDIEPKTTTITDSLFVDNSIAIKVWRDSGFVDFRITRSVFFSNVQGAYANCYGCHVDQCLFLQNDIGIYDDGGLQVTRTTLAQNEQAVQECRYASYNDMLFYKNDVAFNRFSSTSALGNATFLENHIGMKLHFVVGTLNTINFLGSQNEYHIHYTGTSPFDMNVSLTFWNTTSVDEIEEDIYDARDGSGKGLVRILAAESMPQTPFWHEMYQADSCAGQCGQSWFNTNWSSLISAGAGSFGFFDPDRSLHSGQVLHDALLKGHEPPSGMSLSSYMQDLTDLFGAVSKFQTVGTSTSSTAQGGGGVSQIGNL